ncbi:hypothetical protein [Coleofasciculus sp.]|uniref:hypothetical protein n=1 Tax=Coleofasciculus sp. TaxID=3100458 RepID=UPI003A450E86
MLFVICYSSIKSYSYIVGAGVRADVGADAGADAGAGVGAGVGAGLALLQPRWLPITEKQNPPFNLDGYQ